MRDVMEPKPLMLNQAADAIVEHLKPAKPLGAGASRAMAEQALRQLVDQYRHTRVSHVFWNICYQRAAYRSDAWASYWDVPDPETDVRDWPRLYYELHKLGIDDAFAILIPRSREQGLSPWVSLRMNDMHYNREPHKMNPFWNEHSQFWIREDPGFNNGFDYTEPEVRQHYMALVEEALTRWDVDGIELDWMRLPKLFRDGEREQGRTALMTFMREVRARAASAARRAGHAVRIAARVPATPAFARGLGLDAAAWAREGLVDVLIPCSAWRPSFPDVPVQAWKEQAGPGCMIVPGTDLWLAGVRRGAVGATGMAPIRGFTASMLDRGADALYLFNHFDPVDTPLAKRTVEEGEDSGRTLADLLSVAGDPARALAGPRRHVLTFHAPVPPDADYRPPLPMLLRQGRAARFRIHAGPARGARTCLVRAGLGAAEGSASADLTVSLNGRESRKSTERRCPPDETGATDGVYRHLGCMAPRLLEFSIPGEALCRGCNRIDLRLTSGPPQQVVWLELCVVPG